jgi:hypothetical protein
MSVSWFSGGRAATDAVSQGGRRPFAALFVGEPPVGALRSTSMKRMLFLGLVIGVLASGCGTARLVDSPTATSVRITRTPGLFILPPLAVTITDPATAARLLDDINALPPFPAGTVSCPIDFGTSYTLTFRFAPPPQLTAVISAQGCRGVQLSDRRSLWAGNSPSLFADLGAALHLTQAALIPYPCPPPSGTLCYPQPSPAS